LHFALHSGAAEYVGCRAVHRIGSDSDRDADCHLDWRNCDRNGCNANRDWRNCDRNGFDATRDRNCNRNGFDANRNARRNAYGAGCFDAGANQRLSRGCEPERE
jgi:hypothetical protein